ncbi:MAG: SUMF1/EgtB/PvdO family nonheme iron enzyme [Kofleriaceae bacterium]
MWRDVDRRLRNVLVPTALLVDVDDPRDPELPMAVLYAAGARRDAPGPSDVEFARLDGEAVATWIEARLAEGAAVRHVELRQATYHVDLPDGSEIEVARRGVVQVRDHAFDPHSLLLDTEAPVRVLLTDDGRLTIGVLWSAWLPPAGAAASMMEALAQGLRDDGWVSLQHPGAAAATARVMSSPGSPAEAPVAWCALPATAVAIGIDEREGARLAEALVEIERRDREAAGSLGFDGFDREQRRQEIVAGLELAVGASREAVAAGEIMRHPVTNAQWQAFMAATGAARPASWGSGAPAPDEFVTGVSWAEADAFARHHGWSLPTEGEWQLAATGGGARRFPWGDEFGPLGAALDRGNVPWRVGQAPALASPLGVEDLLGAFCEYTTGWLRPLAGGDALAFLRATGDDGEQRVARGVAPRVPTCIAARRGVAPEHRFKFARFRCVRR